MKMMERRGQVKTRARKEEKEKKNLIVLVC